MAITFEKKFKNKYNKIQFGEYLNKGGGDITDCEILGVYEETNKVLVKFRTIWLPTGEYYLYTRYIDTNKETVVHFK